MIRLPSFAGRTGLVTGASSGIGRETALALARSGADLVLVARRAAALEAVRDEALAVARDAGRTDARVLVAAADVTKAAQVKACFAGALDAFGSIDLVVNNAGILIPARVEEIRDRDLDAMLKVNLFGALHVMQQAARAMRPNRRGSIVNVASLGGRRAFSPIGGYCASKFALVGLTESFRMELDGSGVHVSLVLPGIVETPMYERGITQAEDVAEIWPRGLNMPAEWVVAAILYAARYNLRELSVPPGAGEISKLLSVAPALADTLIKATMGAARLAAGARRARR
ncbi:MAG TPA: SDR family oxidoreductase [Quisquiliibacterium sp.]|nr:SDR family oxidoreductase [Quisquiliibacterium sp.]